ncbi:MAG: IS1634 family transposase [Bacteroidetes bacterium]|nr:IS1634 family transposase [Bacteroidota bacterium]
MFWRKKKNKSGIISVQVIDKSSGKYKLVKTIGSSDDELEVNKLVHQAQEYINSYGGQQRLDFILGDDQHYFKSVYENIQQVELVGPELVLGNIFNEIGFNQIEDDLFRHLVLARLIYPVSKLKTIDYLQKYKGITLHVNEIYRYLDKLHKEQIEQVQQINFTHTLKLLGGKLTIVFYDVTTLYFEAEDEDDLRKTGFSKDGKHSNPQIVLGMLVSENGYPLDYEIFEGNKFEGHTMLPVIEAFKMKYQMEHLIVIADSGLMSNKNITALKEGHYDFIIGARIKNETVHLQDEILALKLRHDQNAEIIKDEKLRIVIHYSEKRALKDAYNRSKGIERLSKQLKTGKLTKRHINNRGYNKFLKLEGELNITIDEQKCRDDSKWDGLKGYLTNTTLPRETVIAYYRQLWQIEKTFRIAKSDLRVRPIFHYKRRRIEAHICIAFAACKVYKELERQLKQKDAELSAEKAINILKTIYGLTIKLPQSKQNKLMLLDKTNEQKNLLALFT